MLANLLASQIDGQQRRSYYTRRILGLELTGNISEVLSRVTGSILGHRYRFRPRRFRDSVEMFMINIHSALEDTLLFIQSPILPSFHDFLSDLPGNRRCRGEISTFLKVTFVPDY